MTKKQAAARKKIQAYFAELGDKFRAAPIVETLDTYNDAFDRAHSRVSVELCHGIWCTFYRQFRGLGDPMHREHVSREAARDFARGLLNVK